MKVIENSQYYLSTFFHFLRLSAAMSSEPGLHRACGPGRRRVPSREHGREQFSYIQYSIIHLCVIANFLS